MTLRMLIRLRRLTFGILLTTIVPVLLNQGDSHASGFDHSYKSYGSALERYVSGGRVDYAGLRESPGQLEQFLAESHLVTSEEFESWSQEQQLAFLINLYNAVTLDFVIEHYPLSSIKDINIDSLSAWDLPIVSLFGNKISLNSLENDIIRKKYNEARIHFALVCAAIGCPELINNPYIPETLEKQLEDRTRIFLGKKEINSVDRDAGVIKLSKIFEWFPEDFEKQSGSVIEFVSPYLGGNLDKDYKIEYTEYDWSLNEKPS